MSIETSATDDVAPIREAVLREVAYCLKEAPENVDVDLPFADMGADSLILLEALHEINARYGVSLTVLEIYEKVNTIAKVARYIHERCGAAAGERAPAPATDAPVERAAEVEVLRSEPERARPGRAPGGARVPGVPGVIEDIVRQQLDLMERQLALLGRRPAAAVASARALPERPAPRLIAHAPAHDRPASAAAPAAGWTRRTAAA